MHKKDIFVTKKGYILSDWKKLPKKCSKPYVAQKLLERPKVAKKLPSNLCKSLLLGGSGGVLPREMFSILST